MVDVGTGSGAIALAVAANCPDARVYAVDLSQKALEVARLNVEKIDTRHQVTLLQSDLLSALPERVDIIAANLPYIASDEYECLDVGVRDYEPALALKAGPQGLDAIARLLQQAQDHLSPGGVLFLEIGYRQGDAVLELVKRVIPSAGYVGLREDYHGHDRLVVVAV
jgi:release factor glutamine methyltransferase